MARTFLLDTRFCLHLMTPSKLETLQQLQQTVTQGNRLVISVITYAELSYAAALPHSPGQLPDWINALTARVDAVEPWEQPAINAAASLLQSQACTDHPLSSSDLAIAGHAIAHQYTILTDDASRYGHIPGLTVMDLTSWAREGSALPQ